MEEGGRWRRVISQRRERRVDEIYISNGRR